MTMSCRNVLLVVGTIVMAVFASTSATASDVPGMTCPEIGSFAQQVAQRKAEGVSVDDAIRRLRQSFGSEHADTEHELEKIVRAIYGMQFFPTPAQKRSAPPTRRRARSIRVCAYNWRGPRSRPEATNVPTTQSYSVILWLGHPNPNMG